MNEKTNSVGILKIFNYIGCALIFFGIIFFISSNWQFLHSSLKIFTTLGSAIAAFLIAILLDLSKKHYASDAFFFLSALLLPTGLFITANVFEIPVDATLYMSMMFICFVVFLLSTLFYSKKTVLLLFAIVFASLFFFSIILFLYKRNVFSGNITQYEFMTLGLSYLFLGLFLRANKKFVLVPWLYFFSAFFLLMGSYGLEGPITLFGFDIIQFKILTLILIFCAFLFSVFLRSRGILAVGAVFFIIYVSEMTYRFASLFGDRVTALTLIVTGFALILLGYLIYYTNKKISTAANHEHKKI